MELSTNVALGGVTLVFGLIPFIASAWLGYGLSRRLRGRSFWQAFKKRDSVRITSGFILKICALGAVFLMRLPLRSMREAGLEYEGGHWLDLSLWWEIPLLILAVSGLIIIMSPLLRKFNMMKVFLLTTSIVAILWAIGAGLVLIGARAID